MSEPTPTPEELAVLQKFCKHSTVICENSIEFLKVGDKLKYTCDNCQLKLEATPKWDAYVYEDGESQPTSCSYCGCFILKGKEIKEGDEYLHERCLWGDDGHDDW